MVVPKPDQYEQNLNKPFSDTKYCYPIEKVEPIIGRTLPDQEQGSLI